MYQYQQLAQALKSEILSGTLQKGDKLPSIRELAVRYGVNKDTVQRALRSLKDESFIYAGHQLARSGAVEKREGLAFDMGKYVV